MRERSAVVLSCVAFAFGLVVPSAVGGRVTLSFRGVGGRTLAPFRLGRTATLRWQTSGGILGGLFALKVVDPPAGMVNPQLVFSRARSGSVALPPGRYVLSVSALPGTRWRMTIG
jgi:hypothetical protein